MGLEGPRYRTAIQAVSDELLLDQMLMPTSVNASGGTAGALLAALVAHTGSTALSTEELSLRVPVGNFAPSAGANWSKSAGQAASMARAAYCLLNYGCARARADHGASAERKRRKFESCQPGAYGERETRTGQRCDGVWRERAGDLRDGVFSGRRRHHGIRLAEDPFFPATSKSTIVSELFNEPEINQTLWNAAGGGYITLGPNGLAMNGGNGIDGETTLAWLDTVEMGGTLLLEMVGVKLSPGSTGILGGFFQRLSECIGLHRGDPGHCEQGNGAVTLQPMVLGTAAGTTFAANPASTYTLRRRIHCPESYRAPAMYYSFEIAARLAQAEYG